MDTKNFREACLAIVLSASHEERQFGARCCGLYASKVTKEECEAILDKRAQVKDTWPGVGALVHAMEDEFPAVRAEAIRALTKVARAWPQLKDKCVQVALEGVQDASKEVRLTSIKVAHDCRPKTVRAPELRLLLETCTSDESEMVKDAILHFLLGGPTFSEGAHVVTCAEWLSSLSLPLTYMFKFGQQHSEMLYLSSPALVHSREAHRKGVIAALAGAFSRWGVPNFLSDSEFLENIRAFEGLMSNREYVHQRIGESLSKAFGGIDVSQEVVSFANAAHCVSDIKAATTTLLRKKVVACWYGFDHDSKARIQMWAESGVWNADQPIKFDNNLLIWTDAILPLKSDFSISYSPEFLPAENAPLGIARIRVDIIGKYVNDETQVILVSRTNTGLSFENVLHIKEAGIRHVRYEPVRLSLPVVQRSVGSIALTFDIIQS